VLEIWRQIPSLVDEDKLEAIGIINHMFTNWPERCQQELEPGDGYPAKAVLQYWIARYKEKAEWWGQAIPEYEKALVMLHEPTEPYRFPWEIDQTNKTSASAGRCSAIPTWLQPIRRGVRQTSQSQAFDDESLPDENTVTNRHLSLDYNPKWPVFIVRGLARSHAHLDQEKMAERYWNYAWRITPHCPKLLSEYNCWRAEFLYRRAAPNKVEIFETGQYILTNSVDNPLLKEAERLCREIFAIYPKPNRRLYHIMGQVLRAQGTPETQSAAIDLWLDGLQVHGVIPRFVEQEWLLRDLQKAVRVMTPEQRDRYLVVLDTTVKSIPAVQENVAAIAFLMNQMGMLHR
jgi:tetratricopeptide (TPR) repeat protein